MTVKPGQMVEIKTMLVLQHEHCWHKTGRALLSNPPQDIEKCCWCGEERIVPRLQPQDAELHGMFREGKPA